MHGDPKHFLLYFIFSFFFYKAETTAVHDPILVCFCERKLERGRARESVRECVYDVCVCVCRVIHTNTHTPYSSNTAR